MKPGFPSRREGFRNRSGGYACAERAHAFRARFVAASCARTRLSRTPAVLCCRTVSSPMNPPITDIVRPEPRFAAAPAPAPAVRPQTAEILGVPLALTDYERTMDWI